MCALGWMFLSPFWFVFGIIGVPTRQLLALVICRWLGHAANSLVNTVIVFRGNEELRGAARMRCGALPALPEPPAPPHAPPSNNVLFRARDGSAQESNELQYI